MTWQSVILTVSILLIAAGVIIVVIIAANLLIGADKRYAAKKLEHVEQTRRIRGKLDGDNLNEH